MKREEAEKIVAAYRALVERALEIVSRPPFYESLVEHDDLPLLSFDGDDAVLEWKRAEGDYYGGSYLTKEEQRFPAYTLFLSDEELSELCARFAKDEAERQAKVRRAQEIIHRQAVEAHDRAEFERLKKKYGVPQ